MIITLNKENTIATMFIAMIKSFIAFCLESPQGGTDVEPPTEINDISTITPNNESATRDVIGVINQMFPVEDYPTLNRILVDEAPYTPLGSLRTLSRARLLHSVGIMPLQLDSPAEAILGPYCSRVSFTVWVLFDKAGVGHVVTPKPTRGKFTCGPDTLEYNFPKDDMPDDTMRAMKIVIGTRLYESHLRGFTIQHYDK